MPKGSKVEGRVNKSDLINIVSEDTGMTKKDTKLAINAMLNAITNTLVKGENVKIQKFGTFTTIETKARTGRNPKTGEEIQIEAKTRARFRPSDTLKEEVNV